ncbi:hypothetical protein LAZ67_15000817 [Cordylochernes scorpioides]|uniref:Uncharacterized protein n=1 Tax=Cordylochernes scorpioides TaxID=51811 RepID=A0ABY6L8B4_9ARAC|nr:hypothetical protein LAZ67_15000817 [Cordylochernes scorpioides]
MEIVSQHNENDVSMNEVTEVPQKTSAATPPQVNEENIDEDGPWTTFTHAKKPRIPFKIAVESFRTTNRVTQCFNCQGFGHGRLNCFLKPKCIKCAEEHHSKDCPKESRQLPPKCANYEEAHIANYRGCPKFPRVHHNSQETLSTRHSRFPRLRCLKKIPWTPKARTTDDLSSDHFPVILELNCPKDEFTTQLSRVTKWVHFQQDLISTTPPRLPLKTEVDIHSAIGILNGKINNSYSKNTIVSSSKLIKNPNIKPLIIEKNKARKRWQSTWDPVHRATYFNLQGKAVKQDGGMARKDFIKQLALQLMRGALNMRNQAKYLSRDLQVLIQKHAGTSSLECRDIKNVRKWCREFNEGRINVHDEQRSGRPSLPESTVARIDEMVRANRRITLEEIEDGLNEDCSHFSVHKIVSETLGYRKVSARYSESELSSTYGCEVSTESPEFNTIKAEEEMRVYGFHRRVKAKTSFQDDDVPIDDDTTTKPLFTPQGKGRKGTRDKVPRLRWNPWQKHVRSMQISWVSLRQTHELSQCSLILLRCTDSELEIGTRNPGLLIQARGWSLENRAKPKITTMPPTATDIVAQLAETIQDIAASKP